MTETSNLPDDQLASDDAEINFLDLIIILTENLRILILVPLAAGFLALGIGYLATPIYTATASVLPPQQQSSASSLLAAQFGALAGLAGAAAGIKNPADQFVAFIKSGPVLDAMIERFKLKERWNLQYTVDARQALAGITNVSVGAKDGIISIEVDDKDPQRAADMVNAYVEELRNLTKKLALTEPAQRRLFLEGQLRQAKDNLAKSEIALRGSGVSEAILRTMPQSTLGVIEGLKARITGQEVRLASMRTSMTDSNPDYKVALQELDALRAALLKAEQSNTSKASSEGTEYIGKFRDFKYYETLYDLLAKQYEIARLDELREGTVIQVLDPAKPPERKSKPKKAQNAVLTTLAVFFAMILFVLIRQTLRNMAKADESANKLGHLRQLLLQQLRLRRA